jgi:hypothetical protein
MWENRPLTNLWASTACYRDNLVFLKVSVLQIFLPKLCIYFIDSFLVYLRAPFLTRSLGSGSNLGPSDCEAECYPFNGVIPCVRRGVNILTLFLRLLLFHLQHAERESQNRNKKFWEQLIDYVPFIQHEPHRKQTSLTIPLLLRVFVAAVTFLASRCLATIGRNTHTSTKTGGRDL